MQGAGAALLVPASLALLGATFPEGERARAIGAWAGYGALAMAAGPMLGGFLTDHVSWRAIFYLNVPLAVAAAWLAFRGAPDSRSTHPPGLDWPGAGLAAAGLASLAWGLTAAAERGFRPLPVVAALAIGLVAIAAFVAVEARARSPMLPLGLFRSRAFTGATWSPCSSISRYRACCSSSPSSSSEVAVTRRPQRARRCSRSRP